MHSQGLQQQPLYEQRQATVLGSGERQPIEYWLSRVYELQDLCKKRVISNFHSVNKAKLVHLLGDTLGVDCRRLEKSHLEQRCNDGGIPISMTKGPREVIVGKLEDYDRVNGTG